MIRNINKYLFSKVNYNLVKNLRDITGAPLMNCKKALDKFDNDINKAKIFLKEKNLIFAEKKLDRETKCGVFASQENLNSFILLEVNTETDFVAKNNDFLNFVENSLNQIQNNLDNKENELINLKENLNDFLTNIINKNNNSIDIEQKLITAKIQENIKISKIFYKKLKNKKIGVYTHKQFRNNIGLNKTLVFCNVKYNKEDENKINIILENLAVHCFSKKPKYIKIKDFVDLENIKKDLINSLPDNLKSKPKNVLDTILQGKLEKIYEDNIMEEQLLGFEESDLKIKDYLNNLKKNDNIEIEVLNYEILKI